MAQLHLTPYAHLGHTDETRLRIEVTDVSTLHGGLEMAVAIRIARRHSDLRTISESVWKGRSLDLLPSGLSDIASAMLWGEPGDASKATLDLGRARRRYVQ